MNDNLLQSALRLHEAGRFAEAGRLYSDVLRADPRNFEALYRLAQVQFQIGRHAESERLYAAALRLNPNVPELFCGRGSALQLLRRYEESLASFARALALKPDYVEARNNKGVTLLKMKRYQEALATFQTLSPPDSCARALILNNLAAALLGLQRHREALDCSDQSLALASDRPDALSTHGAILVALGKYDDAVASYDRAIALRPDDAEALNNRGSALRELNRFEEALASYDRALQLNPSYAEAFNHRAMVRLLLARFREGWPDHEWRWAIDDSPNKPPQIDARPWEGEDLNRRRIAIYAEQGLGDVIQFARYLPLLAERGAHVTFAVPAKLLRLLQPFSRQVELVRSFDGQAPFDFQCALMSLPLWFGTELHSIPGKVPYLRSEHGLAARWKRAIGAHGFKVGIAWQGAPGRAIDHGRSIPLAEFIPLARLPGVRLISLQKTHGLDQLTRLSPDVPIETLGAEFDSGPDAFIDTAAVMSTLDLIITSDTSIAHLAGALARLTWVALRHVPDWRWLLDRSDSPWYPTMRLFRQENQGDWTSVFARLEQQLRQMIGLRR